MISSSSVSALTLH